MENLGSSPTGKDPEEKDASEMACAQNIPSHRASVPAPPLTIAQSVYDRLNASLDHAHSSTADELQPRARVEFGQALQEWRIQHGYTRAYLASKVQIDEVLLLCIENGIAFVDEISPADLLTLQRLLKED